MTKLARNIASIQEQFRYAKGLFELNEAKNRLVTLMQQHKNDSKLIDMLHSFNAVIALYKS